MVHLIIVQNKMEKCYYGLASFNWFINYDYTYYKTSIIIIDFNYNL
jgi:hypothetical protein